MSENNPVEVKPATTLEEIRASYFNECGELQLLINRLSRINTRAYGDRPELPATTADAIDLPGLAGELDGANRQLATLIDELGREVIELERFV